MFIAYGVKVITFDTHVPLMAVLEHSVSVARILCPVGS
jgi:hypothetical protein